MWVFEQLLRRIKVTAETISLAATKGDYEHEIQHERCRTNCHPSGQTDARRRLAGHYFDAADHAGTGSVARQLRDWSGADGRSHSDYIYNPAGTMIGGNRTIQIIPNWFGTNEFLQPVQVQVRPSSASGETGALRLSNGYSAFPNVDVLYGPNGYNPDAAPLNLNMTPYQGFNLNFAGLSNQLDFNMIVWDVTGARASVACFVVSSPNTREFTLNVPQANMTPAAGPVDWSNIKVIYLAFLAGNIYGTPNLAITQFSTTSNAPTGAGVVPCGTPST
jgi:hypothetical protein